MRNIIFAIIVASFMLLLGACSSNDNQTAGSEYMPDMYHSIAYEANLEDYYEYNTWDTKKAYYNIAKPRKPVQGSIPRGYAGAGMKKHMDGTADLSAMSIPVNGSVPYYYKDTEEERVRATAELINNPYPITDKGMEEAKVLYETFCGICHGNKGDGNGYLVDEANPNAVYPAQPASFITDEFISASNGRYYHAIMHGKNVMGGYADKVSYEERWQIIHYIRSLQAKEKKLVYSEAANTLNNIDVPASSPQAMLLARHAAHRSSNFNGMNPEGGDDMHEGEHGMEHGEAHGHDHGASHDEEAHSGDHSHEGEEHTDAKKNKRNILQKAGDKIKDKSKEIKDKRAAKKAAKNKGE